MEAFYALLKHQRSSTGPGLLVTQDNHVFDVAVREGVLVSLRSSSAPLEKMVDAVVANRIRELKLKDAPVDDGTVEPAVVERTFDAALPHLCSQADPPTRRLALLDLLALLARRGDTAAQSATAAMRRALAGRWPRFATSAATIEGRAQEYAKARGLSLSLPSRADELSRLASVVGAGRALGDSAIAEGFLRYTFFGEEDAAMPQVTVHRDGSLGAKAGVVKLPRTPFERAAERASTVQLYAGSALVGTLGFTWRPDDRLEVHVTKRDLEALRLKEDQVVNLAFAKQ